MSIEDKKNALIEYFKKYDKVAIAFSGGTDSTLLLVSAKEALGSENVFAITAKSPLIPNRELDESISFCNKENIKHTIIDVNALDIDEVKFNAPNRCYVCKYTMLKGLIFVAKRQGVSIVCEGSNADDTLDYRPGFKAVKELGVKSPLLELGITKSDVRQILKLYNVKIWNKPSFACLASRFEYGEEINENKLKMIEQAEQFLFDLGYSQFRVRLHNNLARIEIEQKNFKSAITNRDKISLKFKQLGFDYVTLDLNGYKTGSMNKGLDLK